MTTKMTTSKAISINPQQTADKGFPETHVLDMQIKSVTGSLERVIRTVRHRGFEMVSLNVNLNADGTSASMSLSVRSERHLSTLTKQLEKLYDVLSLKCSAEHFKELDYAKSA